MKDKDLKKYTEITDVTFDHKGAHLAVTGKWQGYSANGRPDALLLKSKLGNNTELTKSLEDVYGKENVIKMTMNSKREYLENLILSALRNGADEDDYIWAYVRDFNEDMVAFRYEDRLWAVAYEESEEGVITLTGEPSEVFESDVYISTETGSTLIKAADFNPAAKDDIEKSDVAGKSEQGDEIPTTTQEDEMSDNFNAEEFFKSAEGQEILAKAATAQAEEIVKAKDAERAKEELTKSTTEVLKGYTFVAEENLEAVVKSLVEMEGETSVLFMESLAKAAELVKAAEDEAAEIKEKFATDQSSVEVEVEAAAESQDRSAQLAAFVAKAKAKNK